MHGMVQDGPALRVCGHRTLAIRRRSGLPALWQAQRFPHPSPSMTMARNRGWVVVGRHRQPLARPGPLREPARLHTPQTLPRLWTRSRGTRPATMPATMPALGLMPARKTGSSYPRILLTSMAADVAVVCDVACGKPLTSHACSHRYSNMAPPFGFNGLGELVYQRTYSRLIDSDDGGPPRKERWFETVERVVNGTYNMQKQWIEQHGLGWNPWRAQRSAQEMYERIFHMKFLPPGRGLWAMGSAITEDRQLCVALAGCRVVLRMVLTSHFRIAGMLRSTTVRL